jgi:hypothetical protein
LATTLIIFSMDRALQCDSLINSVRDHVTGVNRVVVIARATSELHAKAYNVLGCSYTEYEILLETHKHGLTSLLSKIVYSADLDYVAIAVDDQIFYRPSDFTTAVGALEDEKAFVWSWRLSHKPGETEIKNKYWLDAAPKDEVYRYLWHSDGALYRRDHYVRMLNTYIPLWPTQRLIPNDIEARIASAAHEWQPSVGPHVGPLNATCMTWQINKEKSTAGVWASPWCTIPETELDVLAQAYLNGKRTDNLALYTDLSWTTRFNRPGAYPTHVSAGEEASRFYAALIR